MNLYVALFSYYLFLCFGLFYLIRTGNYGYVKKVKIAGEQKKQTAHIISKINIFADRIGFRIVNIYGFKGIKRYNKILDSYILQKNTNITFNSFIGYKVILMTIFFAGAFVVIAFISGKLVSPLILGLIFGIAGYFMPDFVLKKVNSKRIEELNNDIPYIIDLLYIATLSGQNVYNAVKIVVEKYDGKICYELQRFIKDIDFGIGKFEAYKNVISRNSSDNFKNLIFLLMQAEKYGSSISDVLKQKSSYIKFEISEEAERKSRRITLLILFPLVFLILPSFIVMVCGPLVYSLGGHFLFF